MLAYVRDDAVRQELNRQGRNCWEIYLEEMCSLLGVRPSTLSLAELDDDARLNNIKSLIIGAQSGAKLSPAARANIERWVAAGGTLIGFGVTGLDHVFGIVPNDAAALRQADEYTIGGYFDLLPHVLTTEIQPLVFKEQNLITVSDVRGITLDGAVELGRAYDNDNKPTDGLAVTWHTHGAGRAGYFAFDAAQTVWVLHQGRPIADAPGVRQKANELPVIGANSRKVPYADAIVYLLQNMLATAGQPFIYQLPPLDGRVPDALFYWGGDEYYGPVKLSLEASDWMHSKGLPYHINIGVEQQRHQNNPHPMTPEELRHITEDNGHEISLYYMLYADNDWAFDEAELKYQFAKFKSHFGVTPGSTLHYNCSWVGWTEPARWMAEAGGLADNSFFCGPQNYEHPQLNSAYWGFTGGTGYPFYFYEGADRGNARLSFMEQTITCYEIGHRGSTNRQDMFTRAFDDVHLPIDMAIKYHLAINIFYHPVYIVEHPACREAIEEMLRYIEYRGALVYHMGNNQAAHWWNARSAARMTDVDTDAGNVSFNTACDHADGMIVKIPVPHDTAPQATCDGAPATCEVRREFGNSWAFVVVPPGEHSVAITTK